MAWWIGALAGVCSIFLVPRLGERRVALVAVPSFLVAILVWYAVLSPYRGLSVARFSLLAFLAAGGSVMTVSLLPGLVWHWAQQRTIARTKSLGK